MKVKETIGAIMLIGAIPFIEWIDRTYVYPKIMASARKNPDWITIKEKNNDRSNDYNFSSDHNRH